MQEQRRNRTSYRWLIALTIGLLGCAGTLPNPRTQDRGQKQEERDERTREEVARLTQRAKPEVQWTAQKLAQASERIADYGLAAVEGIVEGWSQEGHGVLDVNSATEGELSKLPGITVHDARRIIQNRPYRNTRGLVDKGILSDTAYAKIRDQITAR
jgi:DNA uptake protein ComE-like DNA-binding protein